MKKFIKDNILLILGISLPLLLVVLFMVASSLPKYLVAHPQYDFFFSDSRYNYMEFQVQEQKIYMKVDPERYQNEKFLPNLYRYVAATGKTQEITLQAPDMSKYQTLDGSAKRNGVNSNIVSEINRSNNTGPIMILLAETAALNINTELTAPDGYRFSKDGYNYNRGFVMLFGVENSYRNHGPVISKSGKSIPISYNSSAGSHYSQLNFIGWVIP